MRQIGPDDAAMDLKLCHPMNVKILCQGWDGTSSRDKRDTHKETKEALKQHNNVSAC